MRGSTSPGTRAVVSPTRRSVLFGLGVFRVVTAVWGSVVAVIDARSGLLVRPGVAFAVLGPVLAWSVVALWLSRSRPAVLFLPGVQAFDVFLGAALVAAEWSAYESPHALNLGATWQIAPVLSTAVAHGAWWGLGAGVVLGAVNGVASAAARGFSGHALSTLSTFVLLGAAGWAVGAVMERLAHAEDEVAEARARERVARRLHDGVLQALAAVQRRSDDPELVALAATQDRELREWISTDVGSGPRPGGGEVDLAAEVRALVNELVARHGAGAEVDVVVVERPQVDVGPAGVLLGAVGEAVTNALKHAEASRITVFLDAADDGAVICSVHDDGCGFDPTAGGPGLGLRLSVQGAMAEIGGSSDLRSRPGGGTEVELRMGTAS